MFQWPPLDISAGGGSWGGGLGPQVNKFEQVPRSDVQRAGGILPCDLYYDACGGILTPRKQTDTCEKFNEFINNLLLRNSIGA